MPRAPAVKRDKAGGNLRKRDNIRMSPPVGQGGGAAGDVSNYVSAGKKGTPCCLMCNYQELPGHKTPFRESRNFFAAMHLQEFGNPTLRTAPPCLHAATPEPGTAQHGADPEEPK